MKHLVTFFFSAMMVLSSMPTVNANQSGREPLWLRRSAISPDAATIAFAWQGDIWTVPTAGGKATRITTNSSFDSDPLWTPDGKTIVFSSYRELSKDIWAVAATGGTPRQITDIPGNETPLTVTEDGNVLFTATIQPDPNYGGFPNKPQFWKVPVSGGNPSQVLPISVSAASANSEGTLIYEDYKGYEDPLRKHHKSSVTRDIWKVSDGTFTKLSTFEGEDRNPVFAKDGKTFWYISEADGNLNVWKAGIDGTQPTQITTLETHPVRFLSAANDGTLCFSWNGELYTVKEGSDPQKIAIRIEADTNERELVRQSADGKVSDIAISPGGKEIALISRGDVYVCSTETKSVRRITNTPQQERNVSFDEDGRTLYYDSERDGEWAIWKSSLTDKDDKYFSFTYNFKEERVTSKGQTCFQPDVSPDGKWVAYLRDRNDLVIKSIKTGEEKYLLKDINYSYMDGDLSFWWSPDSRYIISGCMANGGWNNIDVAMIDIEDGTMTNLTRSGYSDGGARWAMKGKAMTWSSDKQGYRSHGSWGSEDDIYIMFFDSKAYCEFTRSKTDDEIEKLLKDEKDQKKEEKDSLKAAKKHTVEPLEMNLDNLEDRTIRLTPISGSIGSHYLNDEGTKLYFVQRLEKSRDLCRLDIKDRDINVIRKNFGGSLIPDREGKYLYLVSGGSIERMDLKSETTKRIDFVGSEWDYRPAEERAYIFEHCWKQVNEKFYDPSIHGMDWQAMHDNYVRFLPYIKNNFEFQDLLSEMLGELNGSHTGGRYYPGIANAPRYGHLGVLYDLNYTGKGLKIAETLPGCILSEMDPGIKAGAVITAVNGKEIEPGTPWYKALANTPGRRTQLTVDKGPKTVTVNVTPTGEDARALYKRWVRQREKIVEELSGGRIGYVHVEGMDSQSFREVFSKALGKYRTAEALIVDTRHNGGGWLTDDLITFLSGKAYLEYRPRGRYIGSTPFNRWTKPSCVLVGEDNYSDACGFPYSYQSLGIGKLIGAPVPGTMTAVWWETQVDPTLVFGIPQVTTWAVKEGHPIENHQVEPDIEIYNTPESEIRGEDLQLKRAVEEMIKTLSTTHSLKPMGL